ALTRSSLPSATLRSSVTASCFASAEAPLPMAAFALTARFAGGRLVLLTARLGDDIKVIPFLQRFVFLQPQLAIGDALAGLHVVFHAVPGADEVHFVFREIETHRGLVGAQPLIDLGDGQAFAGGTALVQAEIAVGVEFAGMPEYADLIVADKDDAAVTILELRELGDEFLGHMRHTLGFIRRA